MARGNNNDVRQSVVLDLKSEGTESLTIVRHGIQEVEAALRLLDEKQAQGLGPREYIAQQKALIAELNRLLNLQIEIRQQQERAYRAHIDELAREERALQQTADRRKALIDEQIADEARLQAALGKMDARSHEGRADDSMAQTTREEIELQNHLERLTKEANQAAIEGEAETAAARQRGVKAVEGEIAAIQRLNDAKRSRIDALAGADAQAETARKKQKAADDEWNARTAEIMRDRIDAYAQIEREIEVARKKQEAADQEFISASGELKRSRIDAYAQIEAEQETARKKQQAADEEAKMAAGELKRARIDALAGVDADHEKMARAAEKDANATAWMAREAAELNNVLDALSAHEQTATTYVTANTSAMERQAQATKLANAHAAGFGTVAEHTADKTKKFGYAAMNASYMIQDMQYGIGAVANNIGLMSTSLANASPKLNTFITTLGVPGGAVGLGAGIMFAAVAADVLYKNWDTVAGLFEGGLPPKLINDIKEVEDGLKKLTEKKWKTAVDFHDIDLLEGKARKIREEQAAYERLRDKKTAEEQKRGEIVSEAITESGGIDNVSRAFASTSSPTDSAETVKARAELAKAQHEYDHQTIFSQVPSVLLRKIDDAKKALKSLKDTDKENHDRGAVEIVTRASLGDENARAALQKAFEANPDKLESLGIDTMRLGAGLGMAEDPMKAERVKAQKADAKKAAADYKKHVDERVQAVKAGFDDDLEKQMYDAIKAGAPQGAAMAGSRDVLMRGLKGRVPDADIGGVADALLKKAADLAQNDINEARLPKLDIKSDAAAAKVATALQAKVNEQLQLAGPGYDDKLTKDIHDAIRKGMAPDMAAASQRAGLTALLKDRVPADLLPGVATAMITKGKAAALNLFAEGAKPKLDIKADAARKKAVDEVDQAFTARAAAMFARNELMGSQGAPKATSARQEQKFQAMGQPYYLPPEVIMGRVDRMIAADLKAAGKDPGLATDIREKASKLFHTKLAESLARTPTPDPAMFAMLHGERKAREMAEQGHAIAALAKVVAGFGAQAGHQAQRDAANLGFPKPHNAHPNRAAHPRGHAAQHPPSGFQSVPPAAEVEGPVGGFMSVPPVAEATPRVAGHDPSPGIEVAAKAVENSNNKVVGAMATTGNMVDTLIQITGAVTAKVQAQEVRQVQQWNTIREMNQRFVKRPIVNRPQR